MEKSSTQPFDIHRRDEIGIDRLADIPVEFQKIQLERGDGVTVPVFEIEDSKYVVSASALAGSTADGLEAKRERPTCSGSPLRWR